MDKKVTICDHTFLDHTKSASIGGDNIGVGPKDFEWEYADAQTARFVTDGEIKNARGKGQVAWLLEPYLLHPENYKIAYERRNEFDAILAHSCPNIQMLNISKWYPFGGSWIDFEKFGMYKKSKMVSILLSEKNTMPGHKLRHEVVERFGDKIDVFMGIENKIDALKDYRFSIVIESMKSPFYFTEKLMDCLCVGTLPIYYGSGMPYFDGMNIDSIEDIEKILNYIREYHYDCSNFVSKFNSNIVRKFAVCEDNIYRMYPELFE